MPEIGSIEKILSSEKFGSFENKRKYLLELMGIAKEMDQKEAILSILKHISQVFPEPFDSVEQEYLSYFHRYGLKNLRMMNNILNKNESDDAIKEAAIETFSEYISESGRAVIEEFIGILQNQFSKLRENDIKTKTFYNILLGDHYRYFIEFEHSQSRGEHVDHARHYYEKAMELSMTLSVGHPYRLSSCLNYAVFLHNCDRKLIKAIKVVKDAISEYKAYRTEHPEGEILDQEKGCIWKSIDLISAMKSNLESWERTPSLGCTDDL